MSTFSNVSIIGTGQLPVLKKHSKSIREMGAEAVELAMQDAGINSVDAIFVGNMLGDELQNQKHIATLIATTAGLRGVEASHVRAATATGAAALRMAYFAVASGEARRAIALGLEKMSDGDATPALAKALDAEIVVPTRATLLSQNARLMQLYMDTYEVTADVFNNFALNAHRNARNNPYALFKDKEVTEQMISESRVVKSPLRLYDASPVCDGAAAVVLAHTSKAHRYTDRPVRILASNVATDWMNIDDREDPLDLYAVRRSVRGAFYKANVKEHDIDLFEAHDAFTIMSCLALEAIGFAERGQGWRMAVENEIGIGGRLPLATMGGLKARGHPIGATALYQTCEIVQQLTGRAGLNQVEKAKIAMLLSIGGAASTVFTHIFDCVD